MRHIVEKTLDDTVTILHAHRDLRIRRKTSLEKEALDATEMRRSGNELTALADQPVSVVVGST